MFYHVIGLVKGDRYFTLQVLSSKLKCIACKVQCEFKALLSFGLFSIVSKSYSVLTMTTLVDVA